VTNSSDELYGCLESFLQRVFSLAEADALDLLIELDLSFTQARTMFVLAHACESMPINEIAQRLGVSVAAAGRNVDQLVKLGIANRHENPDDRRVKLVSLSTRGLEVADQHVEQKRRALRGFVDRLPAATCHDLTEALRPILAGDYLHTSTKEHHHVNS